MLYILAQLMGGKAAESGRDHWVSHDFTQDTRMLVGSILVHLRQLRGGHILGISPSVLLCAPIIELAKVLDKLLCNRGALAGIQLGIGGCRIHLLFFHFRHASCPPSLWLLLTRAGNGKSLAVRQPGRHSIVLCQKPANSIPMWRC